MIGSKASVMWYYEKVANHSLATPSASDSEEVGGVGREYSSPLAPPREPDNSESGTNPGRQKRGRKSNLMKQRRFFWYKWYKNWFKCIFKNQIRLSTVDNFRAKTSLFPTYQDLAD